MTRLLQDIVDSVVEAVLFLSLGACIVGLMLLPALIAACIIKYLLQ